MDGTHYFVPNYCINDPYFEKKLEKKDNFEEQTLKIVLFEISKNISVDLKVSNFITGAELKEKFREKAKIQEGKFKFRIFFSGSEIKDEHNLCQHKIQDGFKIQIIQSPYVDTEQEDTKKPKDRHKKKNEEEDSEDSQN